MGRPKVKEDEKMKVNVKVRYTEGEYKKLTEMYAKTPFASLSAFMRALTLHPKFLTYLTPSRSYEEIQKQNEILKSLKRQIAAIGNNINQVAKVVNTQKFGGKKELGSMFAELNKIHQILLNILKKINDT